LSIGTNPLYEFATITVFLPDLCPYYISAMDRYQSGI